MPIRERLAARDSEDPLVAPLVERHAARLEQLKPDRLLMDAEALARSLRTCQALYNLDVMVAGGGLDLVAVAAHMASGTSLSAPAARRRVEAREPLAQLPDPRLVAETDVFAVTCDGLARLRATLGERTGIGLALPTCTSLAQQMGVADEDLPWAEQALLAVVSRVGSGELDLVVQVGPRTDSDDRQVNMWEFYATTSVAVRTEERTEGVVATPGREFPLIGRQSGWLYTTTDELPQEMDPKAVRESVKTLRNTAPRTWAQNAGSPDT